MESFFTMGLDVCIFCIFQLEIKLGMRLIPDEMSFWTHDDNLA